MRGLIRGKPLVWVHDGNYWRAESQFGIYEVFETKRWYLSTLSDTTVIHDGSGETIELAQSACQVDHDQRAMASVEVVPFEWNGDVASVGKLTVSIWQVPEATTWQWDIQLNDCRTITYGIDDTRDDAMKAAETFVKQLVMGVPK